MADAGLYTVCASNEVAETCCSAILTVRPGKGKGGGEGARAASLPWRLQPGRCLKARGVKRFIFPHEHVRSSVRLDSQCPGWGRLGQHFCSR